MCLLIEKSNGNIASIAEDDIISYKILLKDNDNELSTPYRNSLVKIGITYQSKILFETYPSVKTKYNHVRIGLHSLETIHDAIKLKNILHSYYDLVIFKTIIPKGSTYYKGIFKESGYKFSSYASDALIYVEETKIIENNIIENKISIYDKTTNENQRYYLGRI